MTILRKHILVISSQSDLISVLEENLVSCGYGVTSTVESGEELRGVIDAVSPDLVIVGMAVSCIEAIELTLRIRTWCQVPIILVKSWGIMSELVNDDGPCSVTKPYNMPDLLCRIETTFCNN